MRIIEKSDDDFTRYAREINETMHEHDNALPGEKKDKLHKKMETLRVKMEAAHAKELQYREKLNSL